MDASIIEKLKNISIFEEIKQNEGYLETFLQYCRIKPFPNDSVIIKEGDVGTEMYIARTGSVEIQKRTRAGDQYTVLRLDAGQNIFFGELAMIDDDKRSATVITKEESEFLVITKKDFLKLGNENPSIGLPVTRAIAKIIASRLRKTTMDMMTIFDALVQEIRT
jgi:CRP/FNR family transcriptional regulator, cyclic AMP receptor protein